jgi:hypothetical protein
MSEEDFYSYGKPNIEPAKSKSTPIDPATYICKEPLSAASVATFWRMRLRPDGCDTKTFIATDNYSSCKVAPAGTAVSVDLWGDGDGEYEFIPELLTTNVDDTVITIAIFLGDRYCNPYAFHILCPFRIRQTEKFYYISQGLETEVVNRNGKKPLTIAASGLAFTVNLV